MTSARSVHTLAAFAAVAAAGLMTVGCSTQPDTSASPQESAPAEPSFENTYPAFEPLNDGTQVHVPDTAEPSPPNPTVPGAAGTETGDSAPEENQQEEHNQGHQTDESARMATMDYLGKQNPRNNGDVDVFGTPATVCLMGDGYHIGMTMAGANTSCDFAESTTRALLTLAPGSRVDLRNYIPERVTVSSPVTQQSYDLSCRIDEHEIIHCTGGNNAEVLIV